MDMIRKSVTRILLEYYVFADTDIKKEISVKNLNIINNYLFQEK